MSKAMTFCVQCEFLLNQESGLIRESIWYNHLCKAVSLPPHIDPYDGKETTDTGHEFQYCREVNDGKCPYYQQRKEMTNDLLA